MTKTICRIELAGPGGAGPPLESLLGEGLRVVAGAESARGYTAYVDDSGRFVAGVSEYEPGTFELTSWPVEELCVVVSGSVEITEPSGRTESFGPGEAFVIPKGFSGTWRMPEGLKKYWSILAPAEGGA